MYSYIEQKTAKKYGKHMHAGLGIISSFDNRSTLFAPVNGGVQAIHAPDFPCKLTFPLSQIETITEVFITNWFGCLV